MKTETPVKFCKDCAHFSPMKYTSSDGNCSAPEHGINLITGERNVKVCSAQRIPDSYYKGYCGQQAIYFKPIGA